MSKAQQGSSLPKNSTTVRTGKERAWVLDGLRMGFRILNKTAPDLASVAAERLFRSPRRHRRPAWEREVLASGSRLRLPWGASSLPAWSWGEGPTVLLVHGWEGRGSQLGTFVDPLVDMGMRVVTFDAPGHGDATVERGTVVEMAGAIRAALGEVGPVEAIVAHSVGCVATTYALSRSPEVSPRVAFIAPPVSPLRFTKAFSSMLGIDEGVRQRMVARLEGRYGVPLAELDATTLAPRMTAPLLVVHDRDDHEVSFEAGAALADLWRGARLMETRGLGHRRVLRSPLVIQEVTQFVASEPRSLRTGLGAFGLERELYDRDRRRAA